MTRKQIEDRQRELSRLWAARNGGDYCGCAKFVTPEEQREYDELSFRGIIISSYCYDTLYEQYDEKTGTWGRYGIEYGLEKFGEQKALEIFRDQCAFMKEHASVNYGVYTDHEGCTYNSISWH